MGSIDYPRSDKRATAAGVALDLSYQIEYQIYQMYFWTKNILIA